MWTKRISYLTRRSLRFLNQELGKNKSLSSFCGCKKSNNLNIGRYGSMVPANFSQSALELQKAEPSSDKSSRSKEDIGQLVYTGSINKGVYIAKYFSLSSSAIGICLQPWILSEMATGSLAFKMAMVTATGLFVFCTPFLLHFLCKRYVTQMYYNKESRTFTVSRLNFLAQAKRFSFTPEEIKESLPNPLSNYEVRKQAFLLDTEALKETDLDAYIVFMKYDEPLDINKYASKED
ncbi:transmembrane protein 70 homolog, mitochondrial-like [Watersipora subatra]|uniref:transmembrane protein 70 homolog, mitochondrial-like n=1 Tax=Watersipora subatra TaxID=2589382 RepID=UPI00355B814A